MRHQDEAPIVALSSGSGPGAVGIIRISGVGAWDVVGPCIVPTGQPKERFLSRREFVAPKSGEVLDDVLVAFFKGPRSYTGQDTVELFCHGGPYLIQAMIEQLCQLGARHALPGEFTKRALLNGKLDLTAAEGIKDLVEASSRQQWLAGRQLYTGRLRDKIEALRRELIGAMSYIEAMIDFPDEGDTQSVQIEDAVKRVSLVRREIQDLLSSFQSGQVASRGLAVVLAGVPNAGKSTLLNTLLGKSRAIVSDVEGTTRDYIEESCLIDGRLIRLIDTAGIRSTKDVIEEQGVHASRELIDSADVVICLCPSTGSPHMNDPVFEALKSGRKPTLWVMTKSDVCEPDWANQDFIKLSCVTGSGLDLLKAQLCRMVDEHTHQISDTPFLTSTRQKTALEEALQGIETFQGALQKHAGPELLAFELQGVSRALTAVVGDIGTEDLLDKIFKDFCIGK